MSRYADVAMIAMIYGIALGFVVGYVIRGAWG